jgi:hypothetical protein
LVERWEQIHLAHLKKIALKSIISYRSKKQQWREYGAKGVRAMKDKKKIFALSLWQARARKTILCRFKLKLALSHSGHRIRSQVYSVLKREWVLKTRIANKLAHAT